MKNPLEMWKGLSRNGKIAVAVGALALAAFLAYRRRQAAATAAAADTTNNASTDNDDTATDNGTPSTSDATDEGYDYNSDDSLSPYDGGGGSYGNEDNGGYVGSYGTDGDPTTSTTTPDESGALNGLEEGFALGDYVGSATTGGGAPKQPSTVAAHTTRGRKRTHSPAHTPKVHKPVAPKTRKPSSASYRVEKQLKSKPPAKRR